MSIYLVVCSLWFIKDYLLAQKNKVTSQPLEQQPPVETEPGKVLGSYSVPQLPVKDSYTIILVGDSMTKALGINSDKLRVYLQSYYPDKDLGIFNYGFASTNIESLDLRLSRLNYEDEQPYPAIIGREFDIIIIESFAYNPLSELPVEQGVHRHTEALTHAVNKIQLNYPKSIIMFMTPIAPNSNKFGDRVLNLTDEQKQQWVTERKAYIQNHINFAETYGYPLINIYELSQNTNGQGDLRYIDSADYIHPSIQGIDLMSREIARYIFQNKIIPR